MHPLQSPQKPHHPLLTEPLVEAISHLQNPLQGPWTTPHIAICQTKMLQRMATTLPIAKLANFANITNITKPMEIMLSANIATGG